jgi:hypothetical protein
MMDNVQNYGSHINIPSLQTYTDIINIGRPLSSGMLSRRCQLKMSSGTLYGVALARTDVSENLSSPSSGLFKLIGFHSCIGVETL